VRRGPRSGFGSDPEEEEREPGGVVKTVHRPAP
jgi:hypothetical protein